MVDSWCNSTYWTWGGKVGMNGQFITTGKILAF